MYTSLPISYLNFKPERNLETNARKTYNKIFMTAPSHSDIKFRFEKNNDTYSVYGMVTTSDRAFVGYSASKNAIYGLRNIEAQLERQLLHFKRENNERKYKKIS